jgi:hypothetical protein
MPAVWIDRGVAYGNKLERHRSIWTSDELQSLGFELLDGRATDCLGNQMLLAAVAN